MTRIADEYAEINRSLKALEKRPVILPQNVAVLRRLARTPLPAATDFDLIFLMDTARSPPRLRLVHYKNREKVLDQIEGFLAYLKPIFASATRESADIVLDENDGKRLSERLIYSD